MAENSAIEWTDATFNPWIGCTKVSPGCDNCYAAAQDKFRGWTPEGWGGPRKRTGPTTWKHPKQWNDRGYVQCRSCGWRGETTECVMFGDSCPKCEGLVQNTRRRVFCASLADVFDNQVPPEWRSDLFDLIRRTPNLDWLLLTKRIGNVRSMLQDAAERSVGTGALGLWLAQWHFGSKAPANVWLGATVVNQEEADRDIPKLLATPARVRFLSMEPLLGPVNIADVPDPAGGVCIKPLAGIRWLMGSGTRCGSYPRESPKLDWVIVGGESGPGARPMHPDWARSLRHQCAAAGVPFLFKQHGDWVSPGEPAFGRVRPRRITLIRPSGVTVDPASTEGRDENIDAVTMSMVGKKAAGRLLDGVTHDGFPEVR